MAKLRASFFTKKNHDSIYLFFSYIYIFFFLYIFLICGVFLMDFSGRFYFFSDLFWILEIFFGDFSSMLLRLLLKVTEVSTKHQK